MLPVLTHFFCKFAGVCVCEFQVEDRKMICREVYTEFGGVLLRKQLVCCRSPKVLDLCYETCGTVGAFGNDKS